MLGLRFHKLDLHTHTPASKCYRFKDHTHEQIVQAAKEKGLSAIAVTDHNTAEGIAGMQAAAKGTDLVIFPGVEISMNEGFHLVALFDPSATQKHVESLLGAIKIKPADHGKQDAICTIGAYEVMKEIHEHSGLAVLAHIDMPKGYFYENAKREENGKVRVPINCSKFFNEAQYDAVECIIGRYPDGYDEAHQLKRYPAFYQSSDNPDPDEPKKHSYFGLATMYSWFKLDAINLEGLRQCFVDPDVRIRLMDGYTETGYPRIVSMRVGQAGFLRNQRFEFHSGLNSLIGGKGVGKSLAVEFLRFGLEQTSKDSNLELDVSGKLDKRLEADNSVEIVYQLADGTAYRIERKYTGQERTSKRFRSEVVCTNLVTGEKYNGDIPQMFPVLAYSQTEVIKIAESKDAQLELLDRLIDTRQHEQKITDLQKQLSANDARLGDAIQARDRLVACEHQIRTLNEQIQTINRSLDNPLFTSMKSAEDKKRVFEDKQVSIRQTAVLVRKWHSEMVASNVPALPAALADDSDLAEPQVIAELAREQVLGLLGNLERDLVSSADKIGAMQAGWQPTFDAVAAEYTALLKTIGGGREAQERQRKQLVQQMEGLQQEAQTYRDKNAQLDNLLDERKNLLDELELALLRKFELRKAKYDEITALSDKKLRVALSHAANTTVFEERLNDLLKGGSNAVPVPDRRKIASTIKPRRFVQLVLDRNEVQLAEESGLSELWAQRVIEKLWSQDELTDVLAGQHDCYPTDVPEIRFCKEGGEYADLTELSVGQKSTALLIIALCDGTMPVIIDQPEDALDVVSVWEDIAKKLRRGKDMRQFILTTHNSSVAVAADSDQFIVMKAGATSGKVVVAGAIDRPEVKREVITHLEGGDEPYRLRARKYNLS